MGANFRNRRGSSADNERVNDPHLHLDVDYLTHYVLNEAGSIIASRISGANAKTQRRSAEAVKRARFLALIPYCDNHRK